MLNKIAIICLLIIAAAMSGPFASRGLAADVLIVADTHLKPVIDTIAGILKTCRGSVRSYTPAEVKGRLGPLCKEEGAKVVIALGTNALGEALTLPPALPVVYGLVVTPPAVGRPNTAGFYVATPVSVYAELVARIGSINRIAVVGSDDQLYWLAREQMARVVTLGVRNSLELISAVKQLDHPDALLLLPDPSLLTATAMEQAYLFSFRKNIPILGISEKHVKQGALLALVFDPVALGGQIGEQASRALRKGSVVQAHPAPPRKFDLYLNVDTARKMGIHLPDELLRLAKRVYP